MWAVAQYLVRISIVPRGSIIESVWILESDAFRASSMPLQCESPIIAIFLVPVVSSGVADIITSRIVRVSLANGWNGRIKWVTVNVRVRD